MARPSAREAAALLLAAYTRALLFLPLLLCVSPAQILSVCVRLIPPRASG